MFYRWVQRRQRAGRQPAPFHKLFTGQAAGRRTPRMAARLSLERLEPRLAMAGVVINEFLAINSNGIRDEDLDRSDWLELKNTDSAPVNIDGWYLADSVDQWQVPNITLAAGEHLLIFASGKDRAVVGQELHTNFFLDGDGDSLKLLMPDGVTVVHAFDPFPPQLGDVSYGLGGSGSSIAEPLIDEVESVRVHVPTSGVLGDSWTQTSFTETDWTPGETGVGYERSLGSVPDYTSYIGLDVNLLMPAAQARDTIYMRMPFSVFDASALENLELLMRYDDGYVAYLNGEEIARQNFTGTPAWNSSATGTHNDSLAILYESVDVTAHLNKLVDGDNMLAIHGMNRSNNRSDFLISPMLVTQRAAEPLVGFMATPTPGSPNLEGTLGFVADTKFSVDRGFYDSPFTVDITTATAGAEIRYTVDASEPTATTGLIYNPSNPPLISTTTTLRAAAFKFGFTPTNVDTQTYIFLDDVIQQDGSGLPPHAFWGWQGPDWGMDPDIVTNPLYSNTIKDDLKSVPTVSLVMPWDDWFGDFGQGIYISGKGIERQGSIEFFTADGSQEFQIDAALEIQGGTSTQRWKTDKLSIQAIFKEPYGPTKLDANLFNNAFFDEGAAVSFDTLIFDAQLNYVWHYGGGAAPVDQRARAKYIQDQVMADLQNLAGGEAPHGRLMNVYLNGLYWGMYMVHERPDESFASSYLGGDKDDYDVIKHTPTTVVHGDGTAIANYASMLNLVRQDLTVPANYGAVEQKVDIAGLIDYMIINYYAGNDDWAHHNWYATYNRVDPNGKWRFHSWDAEHVFKNVNYDAIFTGGLSGSPEELHQRLVLNPEYRLRFADHVQELFYNGGLLSPEGAAAVYMARMQEIDRVLVPESARWGDSHTTSSELPGAGGPYTREHWLATQNDLLTNYFPNRTRQVQNQFIGRGWLQSLVAPVFSQYGGDIPEAGYDLVMTYPVGSPAGATIYYTLDGSDPRDAASVLPSASAIPYSGPIHLEAATRVRARIFYEESVGTDTDWSAQIDATFFPEIPFPVRITEMHYNPAAHLGVADDQDMEFLEITNTGPQTISLAGVQITEFASTPYTFSGGFLSPGERIIVPRNRDVFQQVYGTSLNVALTGYGGANLSNNGERIALLGPLGETLQDFVYDNNSPWPTSANGNGYSLHIIDPLGDSADPANWRASVYPGGSPGGPDTPIAGDYDLNMVVDMADHAHWRSSFGMAVSPGTGADGSGDGMVDTADYVLWRKAYSLQGGGSGSSVVVTAAAASSGEAAMTSQTLVSSGGLAASEARVSSDGVADSRFITPPATQQRPARTVFRPLVRAAGNSASVDLLNLVATELNGESVDAALNADVSNPQLRDGKSLAPIAELDSVWEDDGWLGRLSLRLS